MAEQKHVCSKHNKKLEVFCLTCKGQEEPMCSICMCDHQNERHGTKATHITTLIQSVLIQVGNLLQKTEEQQQKIKGYNKDAEELITAKEAIRFKVDEKLQKLREFYKKQKALVASNNAAILKCHETILKEAQKGEYKIKENIKDPKKVERRVTAMVQKEDYWLAFEEANRALVEDAGVDDKHIKEEFAKSDTLLKAYQDQLLALDITPLDSSKYNKMMEDNAGLYRDNQIVRGILFLLSYNV